MTKKKIIILIITTIAALIIGVLAVYVYRNVNEKPPVVVEQSSDIAQVKKIDTTPKVLAASTLQGVDTLHWGRGAVQVIETEGVATLFFGDDFEVAQGPDLQVYISPNAAGEDLGEFATLGALKANSGIQEYNLPDDYRNYKTVVVWCRAFGVTFATAELTY